MFGFGVEGRVGRTRIVVWWTRCLQRHLERLRLCGNDGGAVCRLGVIGGRAWGVGASGERGGGQRSGGGLCRSGRWTWRGGGRLAAWSLERGIDLNG